MKSIIFILLLLAIPVDSNSISQGRSNKMIISGNKKLSLKNYQGAISDFSKAIKLDSSNSHAYVGLSTAHLSLLEITDAISAIDHAYDLAPGSAEVYYQRGLIRLFENKRSQAKEDFNIAKMLGIKISNSVWNKCDGLEGDADDMNWSTVLKFSGSNNKSTDDFNINSSKWRAYWSAKPIDSELGMHFGATSYSPSGVKLIANTILSGNDQSVYRTNGPHHFEISCINCRWELEIQEYIGK